MAELQNPDPLVEAVAKARTAVSQRPDIKFPLGGLNIIGNHAYAYSGEIETTAAMVDHITFNSGNRYLTLQLDVLMGEFSGDSIEWNLLFDNQVIHNCLLSHAANYYDPILKTNIIVPPFTTVIWRVINNSGATARTLSASFTGKIRQP